MPRPVLPILPTLRGYKSSWLAADALAGLTLVAIAIPEQMATAHLAGMPEVTGFYAFVAGSLLFAFFGRHPLMSVGADSTIAPVFAAGVATLAVTGSPTYEHLVSATALLAGGLLLVGRAAQAGLDRRFLSRPRHDGAAGRDRGRDICQTVTYGPGPAGRRHDDHRPGADLFRPAAPVQRLVLGHRHRCPGHHCR